MKRLFILLILAASCVFATSLEAGKAYVVSSINVNSGGNIGTGESFSLVPQVVVATGKENYVGSVSTFTGCFNGKRYESGIEKGNCLTGVIDSLDSDSRTDALSAYQGKILNEKFYRNIIKPKEASRDFEKSLYFKYLQEGYWIINGQYSEEALFNFAKVNLEQRMKFTGFKNGSMNKYGMYAEKDGQKYYVLDEEGIILEPGEYELYIFVEPNVQCNDILVKPMVTENLDATYDDFISYLDNYEKNRDTRVIRNYFRPTAKTQTINGVTLTNNGDGTYTANGTAADEQALFFLGFVKRSFETVKVIGVDDGGSRETYAVGITKGPHLYTEESYDSGGAIWQESGYVYQFYFYVRKGATVNNLVIKPMLTDEVTATYYDWVPAEYEDNSWELLFKENLDSTYKTYTLDQQYDEILFEVGSFNQNQVYGGSNVVIPRGSNHPMFIPIYTTPPDVSVTPWTIVYVFWEGDIIHVRTYNNVNIEIKAR